MNQDDFDRLRALAPGLPGKEGEGFVATTKPSPPIHLLEEQARLRNYSDELEVLKERFRAIEARAHEKRLAEALAEATKGTYDLVAHLERQRAFSLRTFGPGERTAACLDHIRKELREIEANPQDLEEWIDLLLLSFDGALRRGYTPQEIVGALLAKLVKNEGREWPDWRTADPNKAIEHVRRKGEAA